MRRNATTQLWTVHCLSSLSNGSGAVSFLFSRVYQVKGGSDLVDDHLVGPGNVIANTFRAGPEHIRDHLRRPNPHTMNTTHQIRSTVYPIDPE
jgi:hypothetical protein